MNGNDLDVLIVQLREYLREDVPSGIAHQALAQAEREIPHYMAGDGRWLVKRAARIIRHAEHEVAEEMKISQRLAGMLVREAREIHAQSHQGELHGTALVDACQKIWDERYQKPRRYEDGSEVGRCPSCGAQWSDEPEVHHCG